MRLLISVILLFTVGCQQSLKSDIRYFEQTHNNIKVFDIDSISKPQPVYTNDSINILTTLYDSIKRNKILSIQKLIDTQEIKIKTVNKELVETENPKMKNAICYKIKLMNNEKQQLKDALNTYISHPEQTILGYISKKIDIYSKHPDSTLCYTINVVFIGKQGALQIKKYNKRYILNSNGKIEY